MTEGIDIILFIILSIIPVAQYCLDLLLQVTVSLPVLMTLHLIVDLNPCGLNLELMDPTLCPVGNASLGQSWFEGNEVANRAQRGKEGERGHAYLSGRWWCRTRPRLP